MKRSLEIFIVVFIFPVIIETLFLIYFSIFLVRHMKIIFFYFTVLILEEKNYKKKINSSFVLLIAISLNFRDVFSY